MQKTEEDNLMYNRFDSLVYTVNLTSYLSADRPQCHQQCHITNVIKVKQTLKNSKERQLAKLIK